ncbi:hypothetical protein H1R20_g2087, partial [Candolleomyces eurysporus]
MFWARDLFFLGLAWVIYSIYNRKGTAKDNSSPHGTAKSPKVPPMDFENNRKDTAKDSSRPNGSAKGPKIPLVDFEKLSYYEVLEVSEDATADDLKKAHRRKALEHHPDKNLDDTDEAKVRFSRVQEAYETLSDPNLRADYDSKRANPPGPADSSCPGSEAHNVPPSQDPTDKLCVLLDALLRVFRQGL